MISVLEETAAIITGITIGKNNMGSIMSFDLRFIVMAEKVVPIAENPSVPNSVISQSSSMKICMLNRIPKTGSIINSTIERKRKVLISLPKYICSVFAELEDRPAIPLFSFSEENILINPKMPPNVNPIHSIDEANLFDN